MDHDDNIIKTRLSVNERPVRRLIAKLNKWADTLVKGGDDECESGFKGLQLDVTQLQLILAKSKLVFDMAERERINYDQEQQQIEASIISSQAELEKLDKDLVEAKKIRANKIEYDELAVQVLRYPSRESSQSSIESLQQEIQELEMEGQAQIEKMAHRREQFFTALENLKAIQESILEDEREEAKRLFLKRTQVEDEDDDDLIGDGFGMDGVAPTSAALTPSGGSVPVGAGGSEATGPDGESHSIVNGLIAGGESLSRTSSMGSFSEEQRMSNGDIESGQALSHVRRSTNGSAADSPVGNPEGLAIEGVFSSTDINGSLQHRHDMDRHGHGHGTPATPSSRSMTGTPTIPRSDSPMMQVDP
ncbi:THO complex subunit 7 [Podila minutissima]|uniref:THO complex subunit 7 n=1 Tax=Podila minutissima TaxID=64525 RepID=A0A9P5SM62_9FUNG|nr:THO complex subunit 7 [Podila minutissima]